jgi:hypothetical protein
MNNNRRRVDALEESLRSRLLGGAARSHVDTLVDRDPEAVEAWRRFARRQHPEPEPFSPSEEAAILEEWRRIRGGR